MLAARHLEAFIKLLNLHSISQKLNNFALLDLEKRSVWYPLKYAFSSEKSQFKYRTPPETLLPNIHPPPPTKDAHDSPPFSRQMKTILERVSQSIHLWHFQAEFDAHDLTYVLQMCATARALKGVWQIVRMSKEGQKDVVPTSKTGGLRNAKQTWTTTSICNEFSQ